MGKTILIVDDAASMRGLIAMTLKNSGYCVIEGCDGRDGYDKMHGAGKVDLIVTDLNMPVMDGIEFIKAVKAAPGGRFIPVIMLTTENQNEKKELGRQAGAKAWIVKPFKPDILLGVIKKILG
jgi:two-component system chemotaxis response regulator CheY